MRLLITIALMALIGFTHGQETAFNGRRYQIAQLKDGIYIRFQLTDTVTGRHIDNDIYPPEKISDKFGVTHAVVTIRTEELVKPIKWSEWFQLMPKAKLDAEKEAKRVELERLKEFGLSLGCDPYKVSENDLPITNALGTGILYPSSTTDTTDTVGLLYLNKKK